MNLYRYLASWIIKKGFWIKHKSQRKFQKVIRIEGNPFGTRKFYLEPIGEFNNVKSFEAEKEESIECRYKRISSKQFENESYPKFKL